MDAIATRPFDSLAAMRAEYGELSDQIGKDILAPANRERVRKFICCGAATGTILDGKDRTTAQGLINFWVARLSAASRTADGPDAAPPFEETLLADFDAATVKRVADDAEAWFSALPPDRQESARRALMRMVVLPADGKAFAPAPVSRAALDSFGPPEMIESGLAKLVDKQILRLTPGDTPGTALVALRHDALMREWPRLAGWLNQRLRFRQTVRFWEANALAPSALIRDALLDEAREYHDLDPLEQQFIAASGKRAREQDRVERHLHRWFVGLSAAAVVMIAIAAISLWVALSQARQRAARDKQLAERKRESLRDRGEFERHSALVVIVAMNSNEDEAADANHVAKKVLIAEALGCLAFADDAQDWQSSLDLWKQLRTGIAQDAWFEAFFDLHEDDIGVLTRDPWGAMPATPADRQAALLRVTVALRQAIEDAGETFVKHLKGMKKIWFDQVRRTSEQLASSAANGYTLSETAIHRNLFWRIQAQIVLVDTETVARKGSREGDSKREVRKSKLNLALAEFGEALREWESRNDLDRAPASVAARLKKAADTIEQVCRTQNYSR